MKIKEEDINYNVARLVGELVEDLYEFTNDDERSDHARIAMLGEIHGICQMADAMKEVLKV